MTHDCPKWSVCSSKLYSVYGERVSDNNAVRSGLSTTVNWLLTQRDLQLTLRAGQSSAMREIRWAHAIELPDPAPWLQADDMVLTTGINLSADPKHQHAYISRLAEAGISAVGFGTQMIHDDIPAAIVSAAEEFSLPLIDVPLPTPFIALTRSIADQKAAQNAVALRQVSERMEFMARTVVAHGTDGLVRELASTLSATVVVFGREDEVKASSTDEPQILERLSRQLPPVDRRPRNFGFGQQNGDGFLWAQSLSTDDGPGVLCVLGQTRFEWSEQVLISCTRSLVALGSRRSDKAADLERLLREATFRAATGGTASEVHMRTLADKCGIVHGALVIGMALSGDLDSSAVAAIERTLAERHLPYIGAADTDGGYDLLVQPGNNSVGQVAEQLTNALQPCGVAQPACGIGLEVDLEAAATTMQQARFVCRVATAQRQRVLAYSDLGVHTLVLAGHQPTELNIISTSVLGALIAYDRGNRGDLVASLDAYLRHDGQGEPAAAELGVHRHTLRNRLKRVEAITGKSVDSAHDRSEFLLALTADSMYRWHTGSRGGQTSSAARKPCREGDPGHLG